MGRSKGRPEELQVLCSTELSDQLQGLARLGLRGETGKLLKDHSARGESSDAHVRCYSHASQDFHDTRVL